MTAQAVAPVLPPRPYPVHVDAVLDRPSRWLWLVKWLLAVPHYIVLAFLWCAFFVTSVVAFFSILFTGSYPRGIFEFNVGVMRWSWRVTYYAYGALGTDRYPPFTLADVPDYPAHLSVDYPQHLSRGLVLVKWWLLAIPHYLIVGLFVGGGTWFATRPSGSGWHWGDNGWDLGSSSGWSGNWAGGGLVGILVLVSAVVLAFTGTYPKSLYDVILGMNRWALRVAGYAALMTDRYPPFRLDLGGEDPHVLVLLAPPGPSTPTSAPAPTSTSTFTSEPASPSHRPPDVPPGASSSRVSWSAGRVVTLVVGAILACASMGLLTGGVAITAADHVARDSAGYLTSPLVTLSTGGAAVVSDSLTLEPGGPTWATSSSVLGTARVRVDPSDAGRQVFVGVAPTRDVAAYLTGVRHASVSSVGSSGTTYVEHTGSATVTPPAQQTFWTASAAGTGAQMLTWTPSTGDWTVVVMNADGTSGVAVQADVAATVPSLTWIGAVLLLVGLLMLAAGAVMIAMPIRSATRDQRALAARRGATVDDQ